jgi:hypothetical protein
MRQIKIGEEVVNLDPNDLKFTDRTLNDFFERIGGRIDYIGRAHADAQALHRLREQAEQALFFAKFKYWKVEGKSDKVSELFAKADEEVQAARTETIATQHRKDLLYQHLQALNTCRQDAHQRGHFLRAEMKHLNMDIYKPDMGNKPDMQDEMDQILKDASHYS